MQYIELFKDEDSLTQMMIFANSLDSLEILTYSDFPLNSLCPLYNALLMKSEHIFKTRRIWDKNYYDLDKCRDFGSGMFPIKPKK